jgi:hypothetical protein
MMPILAPKPSLSSLQIPNDMDDESDEESMEIVYIPITGVPSSSSC